MPLKIRCPNCEKKLSAPRKLAGKIARCPACKQLFRIVHSPLEEPNLLENTAPAPPDLGAVGILNGREQRDRTNPELVTRCHEPLPQRVRVEELPATHAKLLTRIFDQRLDKINVEYEQISSQIEGHRAAGVPIEESLSLRLYQLEVARTKLKKYAHQVAAERENDAEQTERHLLSSVRLSQTNDNLIDMPDVTSMEQLKLTSKWEQPSILTSDYQPTVIHRPVIISGDDPVPWQSRETWLLGAAAILLMVVVVLAVGIYNHGARSALVGLLWIVASVGVFACTFSDALWPRKEKTTKVVGRVASPFAFIWSLLWMFGIVGAPSAGGSGDDEPPQSKTSTIHPVFHTTISGQSRSRPAVQVDIKDESEGYFFTAELYLAVQSSRFPSSTWVVLPLNVGDFAGCRSRFVQLPFEVEQDDKLLFNLLDENYLTSEQEQAVISGCRLCGYCLLVAGKVYAPKVEAILGPVIPDAAEMLGAAIINDVALHHFKNKGTAEFVVSSQLPGEPQQANKLSVTNDRNYVPVELRLYGPPAPLVFTLASAHSF